MEKIYLMYEILENDKICQYGNKADDVFEKTSITNIFCYCRGMKICRTLDKRSGFPEALQNDTQVAMNKCPGIARGSRPELFSKKVFLKISENSQDNTWAFNLFKKRLAQVVFCEFF